METVYGDVLFVINFSMDFLALYIAGRLVHLKMGTVRMLTAATVGGIYGVGALALGLSGVPEILATVFSGAVICFIAHYHGNTKRFIAVFALFFGVSIFMGGAMTLLYSKLGRYRSYIQMGGDVYTVFDDIPILVFILIAAVSFLLSWILGKLFASKKTGKVCDLSVTVKGREYSLTCLVDSGNLLTEPISGTPIIFLSDGMTSSLPEEIVSALRGETENLDYDVLKSIRFVPASSVTGTRMMTALVPERLYVKIGKEDYEPKKAYLALGEESSFGGYDGLIPDCLCV